MGTGGPEPRYARQSARKVGQKTCQIDQIGCQKDCHVVSEPCQTGKICFLVTVGVPRSRSKVICLLVVQHTKDLLQQLLCSISLYCTGGTGGSGMDGSSVFQNCGGGLDWNRLHDA